jgi:hypothetical protein
MYLDRLAQLDATIRDALERIERQRAFVADFHERGYDMRASLSLLSCLLVNLRRLEEQRRELTGMIDDVVPV